jgi:hypothetical protein
MTPETLEIVKDCANLPASRKVLALFFVLVHGGV